MGGKNMKKPNIVILGAGYGGMMTAVNLQKAIGLNDATITLVNKNDYHYQTIWLHENAAGTLEQERSRIDIKNILNMQKIKFIKDTVVSIKPKNHKVKLEDGEIDYDYLVIGLGFEAATYGITGLKENGLMINDLSSARLIREHIEYNFAMYNQEKDKDQAHLNIVICGGGVTGIEFAGELVDRIPNLCAEFDINKPQVRVVMIEEASTILPGFDQQLIDYTMNSLESRGVEIITEAKVKECTSASIVYKKDGEQIEIPTFTTISAAGIRANRIVEQSGFKMNAGKIEVRQDMRTLEYNNVFVVGDCALTSENNPENLLSPTAQIAIQQAETVAHNLKTLIKGKGKIVDFQPRTIGTVASLGNDDAVGIFMKDRKLFGWKATVMEKIIDNHYLYKLGGVKLMIKKGKFNFFY